MKIGIRRHCTGWKAWLLEAPRTWEFGRTRDEAIGKLTVSIRHELNIVLVEE